MLSPTRIALRRPICTAPQSRPKSAVMTTRPLSSYLVTPREFHEALQQQKSTSRVIPVCASWFLPNDPKGRTGARVFEEKRIPGARFFDLDAVKDSSSPYPHMLPSSSVFATSVGRLGIRNTDTVVVYDSHELGIFSAPRVAWTFKVFGHDRVHVLNNFRLWVNQGLDTESGQPATPESVVYKEPKIDRSHEVVDFEFVRSFVRGDLKDSLPNAIVLDARPRARWEGTAPEPRPGLPSGHMPQSISVPFDQVLDPETKAILPASRLREIFQDKGVSDRGPIISSCGTGVTAAVLDTALTEAGIPSSKRLLYDGSWTEWAQRVSPDEGLIVQAKS